MESIQPIIARREVTTRILQAFHLKADKNLGQNFLVSPNVTWKSSILYNHIHQCFAL